MVSAAGYTTRTMAYGYLQAADDLYQALDKKPFSAGKKESIYSVLAIFLPVIREHAQALQTNHLYSRTDLRSVVFSLFENLSIQREVDIPPLQIFMEIDVFFRNFGLEPSEIAIVDLPEFIIDTTSQRLFQYVVSMMSGKSTILVVAPAVYLNERRLMHHYPQKMIVKILQQLNHKIISNQHILIEKLKVHSGSAMFLTCKAILMLEQLLQEFTGQNAVAHFLKGKLITALLDYHIPRAQDNIDTLKNLMRLTIGVYKPDFSQRVCLTAPEEVADAKNLLTNYTMFLTQLIPDWQTAFLPSLMLQDSTASEADAVEEPENEEPPPERLMISGVIPETESLLPPMPRRALTYSEAPPEPVEEDQTPTLKEFFRNKEAASAQNKKPRATANSWKEPPPPSKRAASAKRARQREKKQREALKKAQEQKTEQNSSHEQPETSTASPEEQTINWPRPQTDETPVSETPSPTSDTRAPGAEVPDDNPEFFPAAEPRPRRSKQRRAHKPKPRTEEKTVPSLTVTTEKSPSDGKSGERPGRKKGKKKRQKKQTATETSGTPITAGPEDSSAATATGTEQSDPAEKKAPDTRKHRPPPKLILEEYDSMALSFLNKLLGIASQNDKRMALVGHNAGQVLLKDLYGQPPAFTAEWSFMTTKETLYCDFFVAVRTVLGSPNTPKGGYSFLWHSFEGFQSIRIHKHLENSLQRELITFKLHTAPKAEQDNWRSCRLPPYNKLSIPKAEKHITLLSKMFQTAGAIAIEYHEYLMKWRQLEEEKPALPLQESQKLFHIGRERTIQHGMNLLQDEVVRQRLPVQKAEDQYWISDFSTLPGELICPLCLSPLYHALSLPCGNRLCQKCVETSERDATGRLICSAENCQGAHYPFEYHRDIHIVRTLRDYAEPESLIPIPDTHISVCNALIELVEQTDMLAKSLLFNILRTLCQGAKKLPTPAPAEGCRKTRENLEALSAEDIPENIQARTRQLLAYHRALTAFAIIHCQHLVDDKDPSRQMIVHDILNHSYTLATRALALLETCLQTKTPDELREYLGYIIIATDAAIMHTDHLSLLISGPSGTEPATRPQLLSDLPRAFYPELLDRLKHLQASNLLLSVQSRETQKVHDHVLRVMMVLFLFLLDKPQRLILFGQASNQEVISALLHHISVVSGILSPIDYYFYWQKLHPVLLEMGEDAFISAPPESFRDVMNQLAEQIQAFNNSLANEMVYYSLAENLPTISNMIQLLEQLELGFASLFSLWARQFKIVDKSTVDIHPWVQTPEKLTEALVQTKEILTENKARAEKYRLEHLLLWESQRQALELKNSQQQARLSQLRKYVEEDSDKEISPVTLEGINTLYKQFDRLEEAVALSHHLQQLHSHFPPAISRADYRHADPTEYLELLKQLLDQLTVIFKPIMDSINYINRFLQVSVKEKAIKAKAVLMLIESIEQVELIEASVNHLEQSMVNIQNGLRDSHQSLANWLKSRVGYACDLLPIKLMAQLTDRMQQTSWKQVDLIFKNLGLFRAWLETWCRVVDEASYLIPSTSSRRDKRDFLNVFSNLPDNYGLHWVAPDGNCLYSALLMSVTPDHQHPAKEQTADFRRRLHQLLVKIVEVIQKETDPEKQEQYWQELSTLMSLDPVDIQGLISNGTIYNPVSPEMTPEAALANFGEMAFIAPLAIIELGTSVSFMDISDPLIPSGWIEHHENIFSVWLHNAPELLGALVEADIVDLEQLEHGAELSLALLSNTPETIQETVEQFSINSSSFIIIHTGNSNNHTGHFFAATVLDRDSEVKRFHHTMLSAFNLSEEQLQSSSIASAAAAFMIMQSLQQNPYQ